MADDTLPPPDDEPVTIVVYPGDVIQITKVDHRLCRSFGYVEATYGWGIGVNIIAVVDGEPRETYERLKPGQFHVCGAAALIPGEVYKARVAALETSRVVAKEAR